MDLSFKKFEKWTIETAQMKHSARKNSNNLVADAWLRKFSAEYEIDDFRKFLQDIQEQPEKYGEITEREREFCDIAASVSSWIILTGCIKPYITIDEWLTFDDPTITALFSAAQELNPHWFEIPDQEKKTDETQLKSTSD